MPLADKYRPTRIEDVVGQKHIIGRGKLLNNMIEKAYFPNMIFFGPPGVGKTTVAEIIAARADKKFFKINASNSSIDDIKRVVASIGSLMLKMEYSYILMRFRALIKSSSSRFWSL